METFLILAIIATFFSSTLLALGRIAGSEDFKGSHLVTFLTILNLVSVLLLGALAVTGTHTLQTPFTELLVFSIVTTVIAVYSALSRVPDKQTDASSIKQSTEVATFTAPLAPTAEPLSKTTLIATAPGSVRSKTKPVIAKSILNDIHDTKGGTVLATHGEIIEELAGR